MFDFKRLAIYLTLAAVGLLTPVSKAHALNTIRGNLTYNDGISTIKAPDTFAVEAVASDGKSSYFTVTLGASSYTITYDSTALPAANRSITLTFKLNGAVDRKYECFSGGVLRMQTMDVGFTKTPTPVLTNSSNSAVRGIMYYKDGVTIVGPADSPKVLVRDVNNIIIATVIGATYSFNVTASSLPANKTVTIEYWVAGTVNRSFAGIIGNDPRLQTIDVSVNK